MVEKREKWGRKRLAGSRRTGPVKITVWKKRGINEVKGTGDG